MTGKCSVDGCFKLAKRRGLCAMHESRERYHGDLHYVGDRAQAARARMANRTPPPPVEPHDQVAALEAALAVQKRMARGLNSEAGKDAAVRYYLETAERLRQTRAQLADAAAEAAS